MSNPNHEDMLNEVQIYRDIVLQYEKLNDEISQLLTEKGGGTENMTDDDVAHYRALARRRDEMLNEMRRLEQRLLGDDTP